MPFSLPQMMMPATELTTTAIEALQKEGWFYREDTNQETLQALIDFRNQSKDGSLIVIGLKSMSKGQMLYCKGMLLLSCMTAEEFHKAYVDYLEKRN